MSNVEHLKWLREGAARWNARRSGDKFTPDLRGADLFRANLRGTDLRGADLFRAKLRRADLEGADLEGADLEGADLEGADLRAANLRGANLIEAGLEGANLIEADLREADLRGANLREAGLEGTDLREANIRGTNLEGASIYSLLLSSDGGEGKYTRLDQVRQLTQYQLESMKGDSGTIIPDKLTRPEHWSDLELPGQPDPLAAPIVKAAPIDITFSQAGIGATPRDGQAILRAAFSVDCNDRLSALIENAQSIAKSKSNLGQDIRDDLSAYADHAIKNDPVNPHRLAFLAGAIRAEATDPFAADQYSKRLKFQLSQFHLQHMDFLEHCIPSVAEAVKTKDEAQLSRSVTKEEATRILDTLETSILETEAAMASMREVLSDLRKVDDKLNEFAIKVFTDPEKAKLDRAVAAETKEMASIGAVVYFRAKQVLQAARLHGGDLAIMATVTGKSVPEIAQTVMNALRPLMEKLAELLTVLPPL